MTVRAYCAARVDWGQMEGRDAKGKVINTEVHDFPDRCSDRVSGHVEEQDQQGKVLHSGHLEESGIQDVGLVGLRVFVVRSCVA